MYLTYSEYQSMGGTLDETTFNDFEFQARTQIDWYTFNRLQKETQLPEAVQRCMYRLINLLIVAANAEGSGADPATSSGGAAIASQSNDGVSISYNVLSASEAVQVSKDQIEATVNMYLQSVMNSLGQKVLYRGVYPNE